MVQFFCVSATMRKNSRELRETLLCAYLPCISSCCLDDAVRTLEGITLVTCVHIYLGAQSVQGYLCPPVTVSVSLRFHSLCNAHSPLNCLERNMKWSSCMATACSLHSSSRHRVSRPHSRHPRAEVKQDAEQEKSYLRGK